MSEPITHEHALRCSATRAFETYTHRIGEWWDPRYSAKPETLLAVTIEPRPGGRVYATHSDRGEHDWGEVVVCEPGRLLVHTFTLAQDPAYPTEVVVDFLEEPGGGCVVRHTHGRLDVAQRRGSIEVRRLAGAARQVRRSGRRRTG